MKRTTNPPREAKPRRVIDLEFDPKREDMAGDTRAAAQLRGNARATMTLDGSVTVFRWPGGTKPKAESAVAAGRVRLRVRRPADGESSITAEVFALPLSKP